MKKPESFILLLALLLTSCGVPKQVHETLARDKKVMVDFPVDYALSQPRLNLEEWDKDYNAYNKFLTQDIMKTQLWLGFDRDDVEIAFCANSARSHVQLDTSTMISDKKQLVGEWRAVSNRRLLFIDSAVYDDHKIYRTQRTLYDEKEADLLLVLTESKISMYGTEKGSTQYKKLPVKKYSLQNGRFLLGYGLVKGGGAISFVGIDKEGRLILNWQAVEERKVVGSYVTYQAVVTQFIFRKV